MSKASRARRKLKRDAAKKTRKAANYLRYGPKSGHVGRRQKKRKYGSWKPGPGSGKPDIREPGPKTRLRRRKRHQRKSKLGTTNFPLSPLRKRLTPEQMKRRRTRMRERAARKLTSN